MVCLTVTTMWMNFEKMLDIVSKRPNYKPLN